MNTLRNKVNLIGRLGAKAEIQNTTGGFTLTNLSLATHERYKDRKGEWQETTQWHHIIAWGKVAERLVKSTAKGDEIMLEGRLVHRQYETKAGEKRTSTEVEVHDFMLVAFKVEK